MFADHLFTFALSRLTGRFDFTPALLKCCLDGLIIAKAIIQVNR